MAHTTERLEAKRLYIEEGKSLEDISKLTGVSLKTLYRWRQDEDWEKDKETMALTGVSAYKNMLVIAVRQLEQIAASGEIDPKKADGLVKIIGAAQKLYKNIDRRGNILLGLSEFIEFMRESHGETLQELQPYFAEFAVWIRKKNP